MFDLSNSNVVVTNVFSIEDGGVLPAKSAGSLQTNAAVRLDVPSRAPTTEVLSDGLSAVVSAIEAGATSAVTNLPSLAVIAGRVAPVAAYVGAANDAINAGQQFARGNGAEFVTEGLGVVGQTSGAVAGAQLGGRAGTFIWPGAGTVAGTLISCGLTLSGLRCLCLVVLDSTRLLSRAYS